MSRIAQQKKKMKESIKKAEYNSCLKENKEPSLAIKTITSKDVIGKELTEKLSRKHLKSPLKSQFQRIRKEEKYLDTVIQASNNLEESGSNSHLQLDRNILPKDERQTKAVTPLTKITESDLNRLIQLSENKVFKRHKSMCIIAREFIQKQKSITNFVNQLKMQSYQKKVKQQLSKQKKLKWIQRPNNLMKTHFITLTLKDKLNYNEHNNSNSNYKERSISKSENDRKNKQKRRRMSGRGITVYSSRSKSRQNEKCPQIKSIGKFKTQNNNIQKKKIKLKCRNRIYEVIDFKAMSTNRKQKIGLSQR